MKESKMFRDILAMCAVHKTSVTVVCVFIHIYLDMDEHLNCELLLRILPFSPLYRLLITLFSAHAHTGLGLRKNSR